MRAVLTRSDHTIDVKGCPRCGDTHRGLTFYPLHNPPASLAYSHWSACPTTNQPVMLYYQVIERIG